ncbi:DJ-1/PfpI family protein [Sulfurimonas sp. HSL-3221]|uniref:DJ-1 family glyoxalase III n=1 Tax=Sulfurimonadaceae TaxID=2771471 RepID=UPI001E445AA9|nr:DJ-1 family glyoxalase III [Sulfurimonas sp. HSL-3221]UFS61685.1 DJ-1/PfpI family protein [Sulfurimonas sp. HSL-3221]
MPKKVLVPLAEGFEEIEAVAVIDVLRRGGIDVLVRSLDDAMEVEGAHGLVVKAEAPIGTLGADDIDMIVLPGGGGGTKRLAEHAGVQALLGEMDAKGKPIGAICAAPIALNAAGVLKPNYTAYPGVEKEIRTEGFQGERAAVVEDANVMTSRGPGTAICFGLEIVKKLAGESAYENVKRGVLADYCA